jgi:hypothetical protein
MALLLVLLLPNALKFVTSKRIKNKSLNIKNVLVTLRQVMGSSKKLLMEHASLILLATF